MVDYYESFNLLIHVQNLTNDFKLRYSNLRRATNNSTMQKLYL